MLQKNTYTYLPTWKSLLPFLFGIAFLFTSKITGQEKVDYLLHRYDGVTEIITKDFTREKLNRIKNTLAREGILFRFSDLKFNQKNEIVKITLKLKNNKSYYSATWKNGNKPIPSIKIGESFGVVFTSTISEHLELKN